MSRIGRARQINGTRNCRRRIVSENETRSVVDRIQIVRIFIRKFEGSIRQNERAVEVAVVTERELVAAGGNVNFTGAGNVVREFPTGALVQRHRRVCSNRERTAGTENIFNGQTILGFKHNLRIDVFAVIGHRPVAAEVVRLINRQMRIQDLHFTVAGNARSELVASRFTQTRTRNNEPVSGERNRTVTEPFAVVDDKFVLAQERDIRIEVSVGTINGRRARCTGSADRQHSACISPKFTFGSNALHGLIEAAEVSCRTAFHVEKLRIAEAVVGDQRYFSAFPHVCGTSVIVVLSHPVVDTFVPDIDPSARVNDVARPRDLHREVLNTLFGIRDRKPLAFSTIEKVDARDRVVHVHVRVTVMRFITEDIAVPASKHTFDHGHCFQSFVVGIHFLTKRLFGIFIVQRKLQVVVQVFRTRSIPTDVSDAFEEIDLGAVVCSEQFTAVRQTSRSAGIKRNINLVTVLCSAQTGEIERTVLQIELTTLTDSGSEIVEKAGKLNVATRFKL